jgi:hypothetical protein
LGGASETRTATLRGSAAIFELLAQESIGQSVVQFFEIRAEAENSAVDSFSVSGIRRAVSLGQAVVASRKIRPHQLIFIAG